MILLLCGIPEHGLPQHRRRFFADETQPSPLNLYRTPFTPAYWREASAAMSRLSCCFCRTDGGGNPGPLHDSWHSHRPHEAHLGFPFKVAVRLVCGPVMGLVFGFVEDILGFILHPTGDFFPRLYPCQLCRSTGLCIVLFSPADHRGAFGGGESAGQPASECRTGSIWSTVVRGGVYWGWFIPSMAKNMVTILPKAAVLYFLFQLCSPSFNG